MRESGAMLQPNVLFVFAPERKPAVPSDTLIVYLPSNPTSGLAHTLVD